MDTLNRLASELLEKEVLNVVDLDNIIGIPVKEKEGAGETAALGEV